MAAAASQLTNAIVLERDPYKLVSIAKAKSPIESDTRDWHRYVIIQGKNEIVGHVPGDLVAANVAVAALIAQLNGRRLVKPSRV
jgi:hypothetical protein